MRMEEWVMRSYLTEKAEKTSGWRTAGASVALLFAAGALSVAAESAAKLDWGGLAADMVLLALLLLPVVRTALHIIRRRRALAFAAAFEQETEAVISVRRIENSIPMRGAKGKLRDLLKARYLKKVYLDWEKDEITLQCKEEKIVLPMKCPNCGAPNRMVRGHVGYCTFCGSTLIPDETAP